MSSTSITTGPTGGEPVAPDWRSQSVAERLRGIGSSFVFHPQSNEVLLHLEHGFHMRGCAASHLVLTAAADVGLTQVLRQFARTHPATVGDDLVGRQPVLFTTPTTDSTAAGLVSAVAFDAGWPNVVRAMGEKFPEHQLAHLLRESRTSTLIINRADYLVGRDDRLTTNVGLLLASLLDAGDVTVVLAGEERLADLVERCRPLRGRFGHLRYTPFALGDDWTKYLEAFAATLPFDSTDMADGDMPARLHFATEGKSSRLVMVSQAAAAVALLGRRSRVLSSAHFREAYARRFVDRPNPFVGRLPEPHRPPETAEERRRREITDQLRINNRHRPQ